MANRLRLRALAGVLAGLLVGGCAAEVTPAAKALPGDQMVFMVMSFGGLVPPVLYALESPSLVVYGDGRVLTAVTPTGPRLVPVRYELARIDPATVGGFVSSVQSGGLISAATDFGAPRVTDLATTTVLVHGDAGQAQVQAYAIDEQFDTGLSPAQREARAKLRALIDQAARLSDGAARSPYIPDRVVVYELDPRFAGGDTAPAGWPGPAPASFLRPNGARRSLACGELNADPAEVVYRAALDNPGARWLVDGMTRVLAVNSLPLPGDCA